MDSIWKPKGGEILELGFRSFSDMSLFLTLFPFLFLASLLCCFIFIFVFRRSFSPFQCHPKTCKTWNVSFFGGLTNQTANINTARLSEKGLCVPNVNHEDKKILCPSTHRNEFRLCKTSPQGNRKQGMNMQEQHWRWTTCVWMSSAPPHCSLWNISRE